jgi:hypothetical protein
MNLGPVHTARSGQESLAQGSPWVSKKKCLALKGRETRGMQYKVWLRVDPRPFRADLVGENHPG